MGYDINLVEIEDTRLANKRRVCYMVELQIINRILEEKDMGIINRNGLDKGYFTDYSEEFRYIEHHYKMYGNTPDLESFISRFPEFDRLTVLESEEYLVSTLREEYKYKKLVPIINIFEEKVKTNSIEAIEYITNELKELGKDTSGKIGVDIISQARARLEEFEYAKTHREEMFLETGFKELDDILGGFHFGEELVVLFARTGVGKTWVALKMMEHAWLMKKRVGMLEPEMTANRIGYRFDTLNGHFSSRDLLRGNEVADYDNYIDFLSNNDTAFFVSHPKEFPNKQVTVSRLKQWVIDNKIDVLCIDGISYLTDERAKRGDNKTTALTNISEDLMQLSIDLGIPVLVVVQSNREGRFTEDLELESIRDSDGIAYNASIVLSVQMKEESLQIKVNKARNAMVGERLLYTWDTEHGVFTFKENLGIRRASEDVASDGRRRSQGGGGQF